MLWREPVPIAAGIYVDDAARNHGAEPFPHITLVEPGMARDFVGGRWWQFAHGVEQTHPVTDRNHEAKSAIVESAH
jgi:hypothetical protein